MGKESIEGQEEVIKRRKVSDENVRDDMFLYDRYWLDWINKEKSRVDGGFQGVANTGNGGFENG